MPEYSEGDIREAMAELRTLFKESDDKTRKLSKVLLGNGSLQESIAYKVLQIGDDVLDIKSLLTSCDTRLEELEDRVTIIETRCTERHRKNEVDIVVPRAPTDPSTWPGLVWTLVKENKSLIINIFLVMITLFLATFALAPGFRESVISWLMGTGG